MMSSANSYLYVDLTNVTDYVLQTGDVVMYDLWWDQSDARIAFDYTCTDGANLRDGGNNDQNGYSPHPHTTLPDSAVLGKWYSRSIAIPGTHAGKTISYFDVACEQDAASTFSGRIRNLRIEDGSGTVRKAIWSSGVPTTAVHIQANYTSYSFTEKTGADLPSMVMG